jgi:two-component sensor histidine kinase
MRVRIDGPQVLLRPDTAQAIAVILHELATNAAKYGALSTIGGRIELKWSHEADERLILCWTEMGGPEVQRPTRQGFGMRVIERMIRKGLFAKSPSRHKINLPLPNRRKSAAPADL